MEKLNYIQEKIEELKISIITYKDRVELYYWEESILENLNEELSILMEIENDLKSLETV